MVASRAGCGHRCARELEQNVILFPPSIHCLMGDPHRCFSSARIGYYHLRSSSYIIVAVQDEAVNLKGSAKYSDNAT
jgi:hypothetical protein